MKLRTKLTAICAVLLIVTVAVLTNAMLWQVREQAYQNLTDRTTEQLQELERLFGEDRSQTVSAVSSIDARKVMLRYLFESHHVPGGVLVMNSELISAPTTINPREFLNVNMQEGIRTVRCSSGGSQYFIAGHAVEIGQELYQLYVVADASYIGHNMTQLLSRFALFSFLVCLSGLFLLWWIIRRALAPLSTVQDTAKRIASGQYEERITVSSRDEIGALAENFNQMASAVEEHIDSLQVQNKRQQLFIGAVTHELKTPLTSLLLNIDTLQTVYLPEEKREELLNAMAGQLHWLETMVHKLLQLLSMKKKAKFQMVPASSLIYQVQSLAEPIMHKHGTTLEAYFSDTQLHMDHDLLVSALINLIENSAKASSPGQTIALSVQNNCITVSDHGCGIAPQDMERITDPFYMGDPSRSKTNGGYGLGLALVKEIASVHGAQLIIHSNLGEGTAVSIVFPEDGN